MALTQLAPPYPIFTDKSGDPLDNGYLYFGEVNKNPETNPIQVYYDSAFTQPAAQPLRTSNGYVMRNGSPALIYADREFSVTIRDKSNALVIYSPVGYGVDPSSVTGNVRIDNFTGDGVTTVFTLSSSAGTKRAVNVYIDGVHQENSSYEVSGTTLTFSEAPPLNSSIEAVTFENSVLGAANAANIDYDQGSTGYVQRTVESRLREFVSVKDFGAAGDGVTDDTAAIQAAFDSGSKNVFFPTGTYVISSGLNITSSMNVSCDEDVIINGTAIPASVTLGEQHIVKATGSLGSSIALTSNITEEDITITLATTAGLTAGDYILVSSTGKFAAGWTGSNYQGWVTTIESVDSGTQITVSTRAFSNLLVSDTAIVQKVNHISVNWSGGKLLGRGLNGGHVGFPLAYCVDSSVEGLEIDGCEGSGVSFSTCFNCHATRLSVKNCLSTPALGNTGYGFVAVDATQYSSCSHSYFERCRHSVSGGGTYPSRFIDILHNHSVDGGRGTRDFDCHEPCFYWKFDGNSTVGDNGGFIIRGSQISITNNFVRNANQVAIDIQAFGGLTNGIYDFVVDGNIIDQARTGVQVVLNAGTTPKNAVISNNVIRNTELGGIIVGAAENVLISNNIIDTTTDNTGTYGHGIRVAGNTGCAVIGNRILNTIAGGIYSDGGTDLLVDGNTFDNVATGTWLDTGTSVFASPEASSSIMFGQGNFTSASAYADKSLVVAAKNATAGTGTYGGSVAFARVNTTSPRSAITAVQTDGSNERIGLSFWTHASNVAADPMNHMMTLNHFGYLYPVDDNLKRLGDASNRWSEVFAGNGTINTSDGREKVFVADLDAAETAVAVRIKSLIKKFKFADAVERKGDDARIHVGVVAQDVAAAFEAEGLNPASYSLFCHDIWWTDGNENVLHSNVDDNGDAIQNLTEHDRFGIRYDELLAFVIAAM
jgi:hypothetical protein